MKWHRVSKNRSFPAVRESARRLTVSKDAYRSFLSPSSDFPAAGEGSFWPAEQILLTTRYALMHTIPQFVATIVLIAISDTFSAVFMGCFVLSYLPTYIAHWRKWPLLGRIWSPIVGALTVALFHIFMGSKSGVSIILMSQIVLPFCIFTQRERGLTLVFALLPAVLFIWLEGYVAHNPLMAPHLTDEAARWFSLMPPIVVCIDIFTRIRLLLDRVQLAMDQMNGARLEAEAANHTKSAFLANMSHEIRTPMNAVVGMSGLLAQTPLNKEQQDLADTISTSAKGLLRIINDILDYSKIEAGKLTINDAPFDLYNCLDPIWSMLYLKAREKKLDFCISIGHHLPIKLVGDEDRLRQVLVNLIGNAIKYTKQGHVHVFVTLESESETSAVLKFSVTDSGIGIDKDHLENIFESFSQVDVSLTREYEGSGLGLAISRQLVSLMGSDIHVESVPGVGSNFWFAIGFEKQAGEARFVPSGMSKGKRVLMAATRNGAAGDDAIVELLKVLGCRVSTAAGIEEGFFTLTAAAENGAPFDVVVVNSSESEADIRSLLIRMATTPKVSATRGIVLVDPDEQTKALAITNETLSVAIPLPVRRDLLERSFDELFTRDSLRHPAHVPQSGAAAPQSEAAPKRAARILLVEDNRINQKVASKMLEKLGYQFDIANNGQEAIDTLTTADFDLVLMDQQMPVLDGVSAAKKIRSRSVDTLNPDIPIIAVTADAMEGNKERFLEAGMNDYLTKPIDPELLARKLEQWIVNLEPAVTQDDRKATDGPMQT